MEGHDQKRHEKIHNTTHCIHVNRRLIVCFAFISQRDLELLSFLAVVLAVKNRKLKPGKHWRVKVLKYDVHGFKVAVDNPETAFGQLLFVGAECRWGVEAGFCVLKMVDFDFAKVQMEILC